MRDIVWTGTFGKYLEENSTDRHKEFVFASLENTWPKFLYQGISDYKAAKSEKINQYFINSNENISMIAKEKSSPTFFRDRLIAYINRHPVTAYLVQDPDIRSTNPEHATITMEALLNQEGISLYKLAIEEERFSEEYVNAVFFKSTLEVPGATWDKKRPIITVAGPSSSGKSVAARAVLEKANLYIPTKRDASDSDTSQVTNYAVFSDGGIERELSQVRKIAIQLSLMNGYTGVSDLEKMSEVKNKVKTCVFNEVKHSNTLGLVIPETFAGLKKGIGELKKLQKDSRNVVIFSRVDGENPSIFKKVVAYLGTRRAFKSSGFDTDENNEIPYNKSGLPESKAYGAGGFRWGSRGSKKAEAQFIASQKDALGFIVTNDLVLKKLGNSGQWVNGKQGDSDLVLVSNRVFQKWLQQPDDHSMQSLKEFMNKKENIAQPIIHTYGQSDLLKIQRAAQKYIDAAGDKESKFRAALEEMLNVMPARLKEGGIQVTQKDIEKIKNFLMQYREDVGPKKAEGLDLAIEKLSAEVRQAKPGITPVSQKKVEKEKPIIVDVRSFGDFIIEQLSTSSKEYRTGASTLSAHGRPDLESNISVNQQSSKDLYYKGHFLKENEHIVAQLKSKEGGVVRLEQERSGKVTDFSNGALSDVDKQRAALAQAQMVLNNYDPKNGKIVIQGKYPEQAARVYAALLYLVSKSPDLKKKSLDKILECRVWSFDSPKKGFGENSTYIKRYLPDLSIISRVSNTEKMGVLGARDKRVIANLVEPELIESFNVLKDKYGKISLENSKKPALDAGAVAKPAELNPGNTVEQNCSAHAARNAFIGIASGITATANRLKSRVEAVRNPSSTSTLEKPEEGSSDPSPS